MSYSTLKLVVLDILIVLATHDLFFRAALLEIDMALLRVGDVQIVSRAHFSIIFSM